GMHVRDASECDAQRPNARYCSAAGDERVRRRKAAAHSPIGYPQARPTNERERSGSKLFRVEKGYRRFPTVYSREPKEPSAFPPRAKSFGAQVGRRSDPDNGTMVSRFSTLSRTDR